MNQSNFISKVISRSTLFNTDENKLNQMALTIKENNFLNLKINLRFEIKIKILTK